MIKSGTRNPYTPLTPAQYMRNHPKTTEARTRESSIFLQHPCLVKRNCGIDIVQHLHFILQPNTSQDLFEDDDQASSCSSVQYIAVYCKSNTAGVYCSINAFLHNAVDTLQSLKYTAAIAVHSSVLQCNLCALECEVYCICSLQCIAEHIAVHIAVHCSE